MRAQSVNDSLARHSTSGPCLYLGPRGERCARPAHEDGFCEQHAPQSARTPWVALARRVAAALLLVVVLWLTLADFLREIAGWLR